jgi:hypothetical protein
MILKSHDHEDLFSVLFGHPHSLFPISSNGKGNFYDEILFKLAISLLSSSNTWYLREGERNKNESLSQVLGTETT